MLKCSMKEIHNGYFVDAEGNVYNPKGRKLKPFRSSTNPVTARLQVDLGWKNRRRAFVHILVAENYINGYFEGAVVDHIDRNPFNNTATNLRWVTQKENYANADNIKRAKNISAGLKRAWQDPDKFCSRK